MIQSLRLRVLLAASVSVLAIGAYWLAADPTPQPSAYHQFADQRRLLGVPHALNVLSNLPFVLAGLGGMLFMWSARSRRPGIFLEPMERAPYWIYFIGLVLTGVGSAYYHADPTNARLVWDRLPLTVTFMGLFTAILAERLHVVCARWLLAPLLLLGAASVLYWDHTERIGAGDLRFYLTVQFFPLILVPILLATCPPRYTGVGDLVASLLCYGLAKVLELADGQVYTGTAFVSGHTLKHLVAGIGAGLIIVMLMRRWPIHAADYRPMALPAAQSAASP
jgi:hypothetical protein